MKNPFIQRGGVIYIDASHRRKILDPYVWVCIAFQGGRRELFECVKAGKCIYPHLETIIEGIKPDFDFWVEQFKKK